MKYKEFRNWCNDRAFDGYWGLKEAIICCNCVEEIQNMPFWKRNKRWEEVGDEIVRVVVNPINKLIEEYKKYGRIKGR